MVGDIIDCWRLKSKLYWPQEHVDVIRNILSMSKNGTKVKLKGKGFPKYKKEGEFGDLYITYNLKTPTNLTDKEKELFTELSKLR